jgi:hypothetical protein
MSGIEKAPVVTTLAIALPEIEPRNPEATIGGLGGSAALASRERERQVDEELARARHLEEGAEQDEGEDDRRGDAEREPEDALLTQEELPDEAVEVLYPRCARMPGSHSPSHGSAPRGPAIA